MENQNITTPVKCDNNNKKAFQAPSMPVYAKKSIPKSIPQQVIDNELKNMPEKNLKINQLSLSSAKKPKPTRELLHLTSRTPSSRKGIFHLFIKN